MQRALDDEAQSDRGRPALDTTRFDEGARDARAAWAASAVPAFAKVRAVLLNNQFDCATSEAGAVLDGRGIGTVICPDADAKIFLTAISEPRVRGAVGLRAGKATVVARGHLDWATHKRQFG